MLNDRIWYSQGISSSDGQFDCLTKVFKLFHIIMFVSVVIERLILPINLIICQLI